MTGTSRTKRSMVEAYITADNSTIRELLHPDHHGNQNQSLAEATVEAGCETRLHRHRLSEEIYHVTAGTGEMVLGLERFRIHPGDSVSIPPGTQHKLINDGKEKLVVLCCCSPAYSHDDTELLEQ
jgi:mannose-6-phosphate isomerase-like protein (cupin superfamily)